VILIFDFSTRVSKQQFLGRKRGRRHQVGLSSLKASFLSLCTNCSDTRQCPRDEIYIFPAWRVCFTSSCVVSRHVASHHV